MNDFTAAGYGISRIKPRDCSIVGKSSKAWLKEGALSVKAIIGPGTGLG